MIQLLRLDKDTIIQPTKIVQITVRNLDTVRRERRQHVETPEQRERLQGLIWEVSVYLRSNDGDNSQRYTKRFSTEKQAQDWINTKFENVIIDSL